MEPQFTGYTTLSMLTWPSLSCEKSFAKFKKIHEYFDDYLKHCSQRNGLYILPEQLNFVQALELATFVALGDGCHFMSTVNHRANSDVKDSTEQSLFLYSIWQLHSHRLWGLLTLWAEELFKIRPWPRLFQRKLVASLSTSGLWHWKAAWL